MTEPREMARDARRDNPVRFLRELRQLRNQAGLDLAELAARAHYPSDVIRAAETGPALPDLPVLCAYVRGCGGTPADWEERWRSVTGSPASPLLPARNSGWSEAADAGARVGAASAAAGSQDPESVRAALNRLADGMAAAATSPATSSGTPVPGGPARDPAAADNWDFAPAAGEAVWETADASAWDPAPAAPSAWTPAKRPDYAAARDGATSAPAPAPAPAAARPTVPAGPSPAPAAQAGMARRRGARKLVALLVVVTIVFVVLTVVAAVLAFR